MTPLMVSVSVILSILFSMALGASAPVGAEPSEVVADTSNEAIDKRSYVPDEIIVRLAETVESVSNISAGNIAVSEAADAFRVEDTDNTVSSVENALCLGDYCSNIKLLNPSECNTMSRTAVFEESGNDMFLVSLEGITVIEAIEELESNPNVVFAEPNYTFYPDLPITALYRHGLWKPLSVCINTV